MNVLTKCLAAGALAAALYGCSKPAAVELDQDHLGPISAETDYSVEAVSGLLPDLTVEAVVSGALQPGEHAIRVSDGTTTLFEIYAAPNGKKVESVLVLDSSIKDNKGIHIGSTLVEALPGKDLSSCVAGQGKKAGRLYCTQPGSTHIIYELQGTVPAPDGLLPAEADLDGWAVTAMLWDGGDLAP